MRKELVRTSRFLSLVLRHDPAVVGIELDPSGWVDVEVLLRALARHRSPITRELLDEIVATNDKRRFEMSADARMIRAAQGHSLRVDLGLPPRTPPELLFHGTAERFLEAILREGLLPGLRDHVHLSLDLHAAKQVGARHGRPVVLDVRAGAMASAGHAFYLSGNGVWLTHTVPPSFLSIVQE